MFFWKRASPSGEALFVSTFVLPFALFEIGRKALTAEVLFSSPAFRYSR